MRHDVNREGFEVLSAFEPNICMGRAMPELMERCAMRMAAVRAGRVSKRIEKSKFSFRKSVQGMSEKKPCVKLLWHGSSDLAHDPGVEPANVGHVCARSGAKVSSHMSTSKMYQWLKHLSRACKKIKLQLVSIFNDPPSIHTHAVVVQLLKE